MNGLSVDIERQFILKYPVCLVSEQPKKVYFRRCFSAVHTCTCLNKQHVPVWNLGSLMSIAAIGVLIVISGS
jgi:hypothetical protein